MATTAVESAGVTLSPEQFERFRALVREHAGIALRDEKCQLVCSRLAKRLRELSLRSFDEYYVLVRDSDPDGVELQNLLNAITTNKTSFFREAHHFEDLEAGVVAPALARARGGPVSLRVWSAGCSTGEEAYSILMTVCNAIPRFEESDIRVLASDIDTNVLSVGARAVYSEEKLAELAPGLTKRFIIRGTGQKSGLIRVRRELRSLVSFRQINFIAPEWPIRAKFDAIFCRNALIYFDQPTQNQIVGRLLQHLVPNGYLFLGHSESLAGNRADLKNLNRTAYQFVERAA